MDIDRARTFLEIARCGSFGRAAERLHVTQTTVSARIKALEAELGRRVFIRNRSGARLTPAGTELRRYAESLLQIWERARQQIAVPAGNKGFVALGGELSLWNPLLQTWMGYMRQRSPDVAMRVDVGLAWQLMDQVRNGVLDVAVIYAPPYETGLKVELLASEQLVLVRSANCPDIADLTSGAPPSYVYVDWGEQFAHQHAMTFPGWSENPIHVGLGPLALNFILSSGGAGYFRRGAIRQYLASGELVLVPNAPAFEYPAFAIHAADSDNSVLEPALRALRNCARQLENLRV